MEGGNKLRDIIIRDPIHNFINVERDSLYHRLIETNEFQRLRYIKQLGVSYLIYPGATHTRFEHSLGVFHLSGRVLEHLRIKDTDEIVYFRTAALLHDIGHLCFSHVFEEFFTPQKHEIWTKDIITNKETKVNEVLSEIFSANDIDKIYNRFIKGPSKPYYFKSLISSELDIDRLDYLLRDSHFTGNPCGKYDVERLIRSLEISDKVDGKERATINEKRGKYVLHNYILARYFMYNEVYNHRVTIGAQKLFETIFLRAKYLHENDKLKCIDENSPLYFYLINKEMPLNMYLKQLDYKILNVLALFQSHEDPVISDLSKRFLNRDLFKSIELQSSIHYAKSKELIDNILLYEDFDPIYNRLYVDGKTNNAYPYDANSDNPNPEKAIYFNNGKEISEVIPKLVESLPISKQPTIYVSLNPNDRLWRKIKMEIDDIGEE